MKNSDSPAMPTITYDHGAAMQGLAVSVTDAPGLTKREMMAMHAMQGILASGNADDFVVGDEVGFAGFAVSCADALLAELESQQ